MRSWLVTMPSTSIPVLSYSSKGWFCCTTISAPVFTLPISTHAFVISLIVLSEKRPSPGFLPSSKGTMDVIIFFLPSSSTAFRSSGCNITITAVTATPNMFSTIQRIVVISNCAAIKINTAITRIPFKRDHALVFLIQTKI